MTCVHARAATATALAPRCLRMPDALHRHAVDARAPAHVLEAVLDQRDVPRCTGAPATFLTTIPLERVQVERLAEHAHVDLAAPASSRPAGSSTCSRWSAADHVDDGELVGGELVGVDPDADVALEVAAQLDLAHAGDRLQPLLHPVARGVGEQLPAGTARTGRPT